MRQRPTIQKICQSKAADIISESPHTLTQAWRIQYNACACVCDAPLCANYNFYHSLKAVVVFVAKSNVLAMAFESAHLFLFHLTPSH